MDKHSNLYIFSRKIWYQLLFYLFTIQKQIANSLKILPVSSKTIGPPKRVYQSTKEWVANFTSEQSERSVLYQEIYPGETVSIKSAKIVDGCRLPKDGINDKSFYFPEAFVAVLPQARFCEGSIITSDDSLLMDVSASGFSFNDQFPILRKFKLPGCKILEGTVANLMTGGGANYFHWTFDLIPRFELIQKGSIDITEIDHFIVNKIHCSFQTETLKLLGIPLEKVREYEDGLHIQADRLIAPSSSRNAGFMSEWGINFLRRSFVSEGSYLETVSRIYISRSQARGRKVTNEEEIFGVLKDFGFVKIELESFSFLEQVHLFSQAEAIISPHGASLTNLVFCNANTKVLEFFHPNCILGCYWLLASQLDLDYYYLTGLGKHTEESWNQNFGLADITIDLNLLSDTLDLMGLKK